MNYEKIAINWLESMMGMNIAKQESRFKDDFRGEDFVLFFLLQKEEVVEPGEISKSLALSTPRVAKILQQLEDKGLVERQINQEDRRKIDVFLTDEGRDVIKQRKNFFVRTIAKIMSHLGEEDTKEYLRITKRLTEIFNELEIEKSIKEECE